MFLYVSAYTEYSDRDTKQLVVKQMCGLCCQGLYLVFCIPLSRDIFVRWIFIDLRWTTRKRLVILIMYANLSFYAGWEKVYVWPRKNKVFWGSHNLEVNGMEYRNYNFHAMKILCYETPRLRCLNLSNLVGFHCVK